MKIFTLLFIILFLSSCFNRNEDIIQKSDIEKASKELKNTTGSLLQKDTIIELDKLTENELGDKLDQFLKLPEESIATLDCDKYFVINDNFTQSQKKLYDNYINKCKDLQLTPKKLYYEKVIKLNAENEIPIYNDYNGDYNKYKEGLSKTNYEVYLKSFPETGKPYSREEYEKIVNNPLTYKEFVKMKKDETLSKRNEFVIKQKEYEKYLNDLK